jgi:hypothetical protein
MDHILQLHPGRMQTIDRGLMLSFPFGDAPLFSSCSPRTVDSSQRFTSRCHAPSQRYSMILILALAVVLEDDRAPAVLAPAPRAVMQADAGAPAILAGATDAVMLADADAAAVLVFAPVAVMLAEAGAPTSPCIGFCGVYACRCRHRRSPCVYA